MVDFVAFTARIAPALYEHGQDCLWEMPLGSSVTVRECDPCLFVGPLSVKAWGHGVAPARITCDRPRQVRHLPQPDVERLEASRNRFRGLPPPSVLAYPVDPRKEIRRIQEVLSMICPAF